MINELIFFLHVVILVAFILGALRMGKEALSAAFCLQAVMANLFVTKQMVCFGLTVTCSDVYTIGALFSLNLIQEFFNKKTAQRAVAAAFLMMLFFTVMGELHLSYLPAPVDQVHGAFAAILSSTPRIMAASLIVTLLVQRCDIALFALLKRLLPNQPFFLRFGLSSLATQFIDTLLFTFLGLYGIIHSLFDVIVMSYLIKAAVIFTLAPFTTLSKRFAVAEEPL